MAILPVVDDDVEIFTTIINPVRTYISSSSGITGSILLFSRNSHIEKEIKPLENYNSSIVNDQNLEIFRMAAARAAADPNKVNFKSSVKDYLLQVNQQSESQRKKSKINIIRFTPSVSFTSNTLRKLNVKDMLMSYYKSQYHNCNWAYTNYNTLNFFTSPSVPTSSVLLYPDPGSNPNLPDHVGYVSGTYALSGGFSFDFRVNPRYKVDDIDPGYFKAGTLFHLSSSYCLSLITGSKIDENGLPISFRLQLQLSHSADIPPSLAKPGSYPNDLIFLSDDNCLNWNNWHRVVVRWGTNLINDGYGTFNIDGKDYGNFYVPSGTIMPRSYANQGRPAALCVGNFYEGSNDLLDNNMSWFFSGVSAYRDGLNQLLSDVDRDQPKEYAFNHPLKAEVHELAIRRYYMTDKEIIETQKTGIEQIDEQKLAFYLPPFFVESTPIRRYTQAPILTGGEPYGGILQTPFFTIDGSTDDPFNVAMSFGVNGHYINLENFIKDFANEIFPRLHHLSGTAINYTTTARSANEFLYDDPFVRRRNLSILPCDDGNFVPNFGLLSAEAGTKFTDDYGRQDLSLISLNDLLSTSSLLFGANHDDDHDPTLLQQQVGFTPEQPGLQPGAAIFNAKKNIELTLDEGTYGPGVNRSIPLTIFQRTKDASSNQVTFFDISNLYFGSRILPGSFLLKDNKLTGSAGKISISLKDDGFGNIYRSDSLTTPCSWNSVGNIFYDEGIVVIKSPHLYFFGKDGYEISFKGQYNLYTSKYEILAPGGLINSSSNPTYARVQDTIKPSQDPLDNDSFVYISNLNFHDENLNVIAKATFAQPFIKRDGDKILVKIAFDF
jgi:hypothetical protein